MSNSTTEDGNLQNSEALVTSARAQLTPLLTGVINALASGGGTGSFFTAGGFVQALQDRLRSIENESELLHLLSDTSLIGCQGFELSDAVQHAVDALLGECEIMAQTLVAGDEPH